MTLAREMATTGESDKGSFSFPGFRIIHTWGVVLMAGFDARIRGLWQKANQ